MSTARITALIIVESCFGGTRALAEQITAGLTEAGVGAALVSSDEAPTMVPPELDLLVLAAPTHNRGLPTPGSRRQAVGRGGRAAGRGIREWLEEASIPDAVEVIAVDTVTGRGWMSGSAAKRIAKTLARQDPERTVRTRSFLVDAQGPAAGQAQEALTWGRELARG